MASGASVPSKARSESERTRIEHDLLGELEVPAEAYWGVHTARALLNFPVSGTAIGSLEELIVALAQVKRSAVEANHALGLIPDDVHAATVQACIDVEAGGLRDQFVVDIYQGGAGTSTNMNINEVLANRALEILGRARGDYAAVHPLEHINLGQSTNDVYPTALRLSAIRALGRLTRSLEHLRGTLQGKELEFAPHIKMARTQLQDAVPMTMGQEFGSFAVMIGEDIRLLEAAARLLHEVHLGGTAIGTGLNASVAYQSRVLAELVEISGLPLVASEDLVEATQDVGGFVHVSGVLKRVAVKLSKICNDLRLLSSGPRAGLSEIRLPPQQAGSSIMPGKVNPVVPELVNQLAFEAIGSDLTVTLAAEAGQLQLNAFEPIIAVSLFRTIDHLSTGAELLADRCVAGITANVDQCRMYVERSVGIVTVLAPTIGYEAATSVALEAVQGSHSVRDVVLRRGLMTAEEIDTLLSTPGSLTGKHTDPRALPPNRA